METINTNKGYALRMLTDDEAKPCGDCRACCTVLGVTELHKGHYRPCQHECGKGCAIYEERPLSCRLWNCGWRAGVIEGDERRRPDKLGLIFDGTKLGIYAWEVWPGASQEPAARYQIAKLRQRHNVYVITREIAEEWNQEMPEFSTETVPPV